MTRRATCRMHAFATPWLAAASVAVAVAASGCSGTEPAPSGAQALESMGPRGQTTLSVSGPEGVRGGVTRSEPAYFSIELAVAGPAGAMSVIRVPNPHPRGCNVSGGLPAYAELDGSGTARVEAWVTFWAADACEFEVVAETGMDYRGYRPDPDTGRFLDYELSGESDAATLSVSFAHLDPS